MNGPILLRLDRSAPVDGVAGEIKHAAEGGLADGDFYRGARVKALHAADHAVGAAQGDAADAPAAEVLLHLAGQIELYAFVLGRDLHRVVDGR